MAQQLDHSTHSRRDRLQKVEGFADLLTLGLIVALGIAMVIGLITASGSVTW